MRKTDADEVTVAARVNVRAFMAGYGWRALGGLVAAALLGSCRQDAAIVQPLQFSHRAHTSSGLPCVGCHPQVEQVAAAGMPPLETCLLCHRGAITESTEEEKVRQLADAGAELRWRRLYRLPDYVYFSHRRHVTEGGVECTRCHGDIGDTVAPPPRPAVTHTMASCMECHAERHVSNDCIRCHV
jgi:hypothetical protein